MRPYFAPQVPPIRLNNSARLSDLIRAGNLYLTAQDAIALALENNIDLEVARYNPPIAAWNLDAVPSRRRFAGRAQRRVASRFGRQRPGRRGQPGGGGRRRRGRGGGGGSGGNATISQIGPIAQTLDPSIQESSVFSHTTTPEPNATQSITSVLVDTTHVHNALPSGRVPDRRQRRPSAIATTI